MGVSKLTKCAVLTVLAFWGLAVMHCQLEAVPGLGFLKVCCFVDPGAPIPAEDCDSDGCGDVEKGGYRMEEQTVSPLQSPLILAVLSVAIQSPEPVLEPVTQAASFPPPDLPAGWQFSLRTALSPRAPSFTA